MQKSIKNKAGGKVSFSNGNNQKDTNPLVIPIPSVKVRKGTKAKPSFPHQDKRKKKEKYKVIEE